MTIKDRIRERMEALDLNAKQLSVEAGLNATYVREIMRTDDPNPRLQHITAVAKRLGVSVAWLHTGVEPSVVMTFGGRRLSQKQAEQLEDYVEFITKDEA